MILESPDGLVHPFRVLGALQDRLGGKILMFRSRIVSQWLQVAQGYQPLYGYWLEIENVSRSSVIDFTGKYSQVQEGEFVTVI
jgi:hypothetical protein